MKLSCKADEVHWGTESSSKTWNYPCEPGQDHNDSLWSAEWIQNGK